MHTDEKSLRYAVDKWLAPTPAMPARVVRFCVRARYVCVEALRPTGVCVRGLSGLKNRRQESAAARAGLKAARPSSYQW